MKIETHSFNKSIDSICRTIMRNAGWKVKPRTQTPREANDADTIYLAKDSSEHYVGFCRVTQSPWAETEIKEICVDPHYRHKGVGKKLVSAVERNTKNTVILAWAVDDGPEFYESIGFKKSSAPMYFKKPAQ